MSKVRKVTALAALAIVAASGTNAFARDTVYKLSFAELLASPGAKGKLDPSIRFYLAGQTTPAVVTRGAELVTNRKTNGVGKGDRQACQWAALGALIVLQDRAREAGDNAVIDIVSFFKKNTFSSPTEYECHAGGVVVGVALKGVIATIGE
jgi:hypothetical protein